ncbi:iron-siderophore ABC transporter substrate-binding protein [Mesorhizobium sp. SB112]|uniref:iron-siderophore ABC transporter substrate-binding protein n=1 Tax=Mesorhizobium sp. SB112 TaxID=3151853 RepID=UPI0032678B1E
MLTRRQAIGVLAGAALSPTLARATPSRVAAIDWAMFETALALGVVPIAATELKQFREIAIEPAVPESVADLGLRGTPNYELLRSAGPDLILSSNFYEGQRGSLERIAPVFSAPVYLPGSPPYALAEDATLLLGKALGLEAKAVTLIDESNKEINALRISLSGLEKRRVYIISIGDPRHFRAFGRDSMFGDVLSRLGLENAWQEDTSYSAAAPVGLEALANNPQARVIIIAPIPPEARWTLSTSALWKALPMVAQNRVSIIDPVNHFGALPVARRFARLAAQSMLSAQASANG